MSNYYFKRVTDEETNYYIAIGFKPKKLSKDWKEITKEQYEEETRPEEEIPEE